LNTLVKILRILWPFVNENLKEQGGSAASVLAFMAIGAMLLSPIIKEQNDAEFRLYGHDWSYCKCNEETVVKPPVHDVEEAPVDELAPDVTDEADLLDVIEGADVPGVVMLSPVVVAWDDSYEAPLLHRRSSFDRLGGWSAHTARQRAYRGAR
jgi:hypothetical protein